MTARIGSCLRWHPWSIELRLLAHALRNGLWRSLSPARSKAGCEEEQQVLTWSTFLPDRGSSRDIVSYLRQAGLRVEEGGNAFYLPPQPGLADVLGSAVECYPPASGFKVLRDFRGLEEAHYLHPERQTPVRRRLIGSPCHQLITANYLHRLDLGPRVWDVCVLRAGRVPMLAFVVQDVPGPAPDADDCSAFLARLRAVLATTELRITVPNWQRSKDFRCPTCNHNLLRDAGGALKYIDFQNFSVRNPRRIGESTAGGAPAPRPAGGGETGRFETVRRLLHEHGVDLHRRLVLDIGCDAGARLFHALSAGAWWAVGWDRPAAASRAQALAVARGFTRLDITPADLNDQYDLGASIPNWLDRHLADSVVLFFMVRQPLGIPASLAALPWRALVYAGHPGQSLAEANDHVRVLTTRGVRVAHRISIRDAEFREQPLLLLIRDSVAATAGALTIRRRSESGRRARHLDR